MKIRRSLLSTIFLICLILELHTDPAVANEQQIKNIRKVLAAIKCYQKGYDFFRKSKLWTQDYHPERSYFLPDRSYSALEHDLHYMDAQARHGTSFSDLQITFFAQVLASVYALKMKKAVFFMRVAWRLAFFFNQEEYERLGTAIPNAVGLFNYLAKYSSQNKSVSPAILNMLETTYPQAYHEFERVSNLFTQFQELINDTVVLSEEYDYDNWTVEEEGLPEIAQELIKYIRTAFLQIDENGPESGLGIDAQILKLTMIDASTFLELIEEDPNVLYPNYDDHEDDMYRSTAMHLLRTLIWKIAYKYSDQIGLAALNPITSVIHVQLENADSNTLVFTEIPYRDIGEASAGPSNPDIEQMHQLDIDDDDKKGN